ncbi:hypothetical protein [Flavobacterium sp. N1994]|uniref:hypothetical protein n=1 Tax=Flavobacterium sp. N1994 TaxID=2986827 RepID=UPI002221CFA7|nr:hypothetical protein [Flavobacterium sp. N1994]
MKKLWITLLFLVGTTIAFAQTEKQDDHQENDQDKIDQQPQSPDQVLQERRAKVEAQAAQYEKESKQRDAEQAKEKAAQLAKEKAKKPAVVKRPLKKK